MKEIMLIIPARYHSSRFPGKPLADIAGVPMLKRVADIAQSVCNRNADCTYIIATDDSRILDFCREYHLPVISTSSACQSGTERCLDVIRQRSKKPKFIINLQGDNPLCPPTVIQALIDEWRVTSADIFTPYIPLDWNEYDQLIKNKQTTPFSGTTVQVNREGFAMTFSKNVLPAIRNVTEAKKKMTLSPVKRHIGLYGYTYTALSAYCDLPETIGELSYIEGLEQMRFLENGLKIKMVPVDYLGRQSTSGVDSPDDICRVERILSEFGELDLN